MKSKHLTEATLDEIEELAKSNAAETYRGALLAVDLGSRAGSEP